MTKEEIKINLTPYLNRYRDCPEWRQAFDLYNQEHNTTLKMNCSKCFTTVKEWLKR